MGTVTEIYDYLRLLYARIGIPHCPMCGREIKQQTIDQIVDQVLALPEETRVQILAPVVRGRKGEHQKEFEAARKSGFVRARVDGLVYDLAGDHPAGEEQEAHHRNRRGPAGDEAGHPLRAWRTPSRRPRG